VQDAPDSPPSRCRRSCCRLCTRPEKHLGPAPRCYLHRCSDLCQLRRSRQHSLRPHVRYVNRLFLNYKHLIHPFPGTPGTYGAAAGDLSPDISGGPCGGSIDTTQCNGQTPIDTYAPPRCPTGNCGTCYQVTNAGGMEGAEAGGTGQSIIVQIIDSCPSTNAWNFCKTDVSPEQRCGAGGVNHLDIDQSAHSALTGTGGVSFPLIGIV